MGGSIDWRPLGAASPDALADARLQAHYAAQWLARAARANLPAQADDSHLNLGWEGAADGFATHAFTNGTRLALIVPELTIALLAPNGARASSLALAGRTEAAVRAGLAAMLDEAGLAVMGFDDPLGYDMPAHPLAQGAAYGGQGLGAPLTELAAWFANGAVLIEGARAAMAANGHPAPGARCWPHHFDLATLATYPMADGATAYVGAGISPGDGFYAEPYFYASFYPRPELAALPELPAPAHWHTHEFFAAVATASKIRVAARPREDTGAAVAAALAAGFATLK